ncbi:hypothetical protein ABZX30_36665 [Streptomyces sp. NPDC004542]|uniref:hypothetical protein n=1 Tax=Streptomyces sp. NPDC004542 TaxID=3154281 RepID=UPI0033AF6409
MRRTGAAAGTAGPERRAVRSDACLPGARSPADVCVLVVAPTACALLQSLINPALPVLRSAPHTDARSVTWITTACLPAPDAVRPCHQGMGGGRVPLSFGVIRDEFPPAKVPGAIAVMSALLAVGGGPGLLVSFIQLAIDG